MGLGTFFGRLFSLAFFTYAALYFWLRAGDTIHFLRYPEFTQLIMVIVVANYVLPRFIGIPVPDLKLQLLIGMLTSYYYLDVHTAARSFPPIDLSGKVAVVTGGNSGIGRATAVALAERNATVVIACRNDRLCQVAAEEMEREVADSVGGTGKVVPMRLDLADLAIVDYFSLMLARQYPRVDILVNNAGYHLGGLKQEPASRQGLERSFATMHVGHFALTEWLIRRNEGGAEGVVVMNVASGMHHMCQWITAVQGVTGGGWDDACMPARFFKSKFKDVGPKGYAGFKHLPMFVRKLSDLRYMRAKLANVLHTIELPKRHKGLHVTAADLGFVSSNITAGHKLLQAELVEGMPTLDQFFMRQTAPHGIRPVLLGALLPLVKPWAKSVGIKSKNGALIDPIGNAVYPFSLEKATGLKDVGGQKKLAKKLYDVSAAILADFEASRGGSLDERMD
uniref:Uncharacterized protein n=1 Tax=Phaeomonas parva TaxID=124430 RepID=A0A7S1U1J8_9STRA